MSLQSVADSARRALRSMDTDDAVLVTQSIGKMHKVRFPNGDVIRSHWYHHPWMTASGKVSTSPRDGLHKMTPSEVRKMDTSYRLWKADKDARSA